MVNSAEAIGTLMTFWGFAGIKHTTQEHGYIFHDEETRKDSAQVAGKISFKPGHPDVEAFKFLKSLTDGKDVTPRQSIPAPAQFYAELVRGDENLLLYGNTTLPMMNSSMILQSLSRFNRHSMMQAAAMSRLMIVLGEWSLMMNSGQQWLKLALTGKHSKIPT